MSVLRRRIMNSGLNFPPGHPWGTEATPMVMPLALVTYDREIALYQTLHPLVTADGAVVPGAHQFYWPGDMAAHGGHDANEVHYG